MPSSVIERLQRGIELQRSGQQAAAEACYREVLAEDAGNRHALNLLGALCVNSGRSAEAEPLIRKALLAAPADAQALANLGLALKELGRFGESADALKHSIARHPGNAVVHNNLGNVLRELGQLQEAARSYEQALQLDPRYAHAWSNLGAVGFELGRYPRALQAADRAIALDPDFAQAHKVRGDILRRESRLDEAEQAYRDAIRLDPPFHEAQIELAETLRNRGDVQPARAMLEQILAADPRIAMAHHGLGVLLEQIGERDAAAACYSAAIAIAPELTIAHYQIAQLKGRRTSDEELALRTALFERDNLRPEQRSPLAFALAIAHEERGEYERAYSYFATGNELKAERHPYDDSKSLEFGERIRASFLRSSVPLPSPGDSPGACPVFVLGMPRSGTSLTEQILASHPDVYGAGELSFMEDTGRRSKRLCGEGFPECGALLDAGQYAELGAYYLSRHSDEARAYRFLVDKTPMNFQYIGLIVRMLPQARIIHCTRDPIDNCVAIWRRPFDDQHTYSHDLAALGRYYSHYQQLMRFWEEKLPGRILEVRYEDTVADLERQSRRMLEFLGLPFNDAVLDFHLQKRQVRTPSASQVRQPIYTDSVQAWRRYEPWLAPLLVALGSD